MNKSKLRGYARLIAKCGLNVKKKQDVIVQTGLSQVDFVEIVVEELYKAGARKVFVDFYHLPIVKLNNLYRDKEEMAKIEDFELEKIKWRSKTLPCILFLDSEDPDGLNGIDQSKESYASSKRYPIIKPFIDEMENELNRKLLETGKTGEWLNDKRRFESNERKKSLWVEGRK